MQGTVDKLSDNYTLRITPKLHEEMQFLPEEIRKQMNKEIRIIIAKYIHMAKFKAEDYLGE